MMNKMKKWTLAVIAICGASVLTSCSLDNSDNPADNPEKQAETFSIATLNVDGLPQTLNIMGLLEVDVNKDGPGKEWTPTISQYLANKGYDFMFVQENFDYNEELSSSLLANYERDAWNGGFDLEKMVDGCFPFDGLNGFWKKGITAQRTDSVKWTASYGVMEHAWDGIVTKGFRRYDVKLKGGAELVIYNMHMDASDSDDEVAGEDGPDREALMVQWRQLRDYILEHLDTRPVIVAGDLNSWYARDSIKTQFIDYIGQTGLATVSDVWIELERGGNYPEMVQGIVTKDDIPYEESRNGETLDKILYLNPTNGAQLVPVSVSIDRTGYLRTDGVTPLGDHYPLAVTFQIK